MGKKIRSLQMNCFEVKKDIDLIMYGIPRSANTLTRMIINEIIKRKNLNINFESTHHFLGSKKNVNAFLEIYNNFDKGNITPEEFHQQTFKVIKMGYDKKEPPVIICVRDIFDAYISYVDALQGYLEDCKNKKIKPNREHPDPFIWIAEHFLYFFMYYNQMLSGRKTFILRYEDFNGDTGLKNRIIKLSEILETNISENEVNDIAEMFSIEKNKKIADKFKHFGEWDEETMLHGNHIGELKGASGLSNFYFPIEEKLSIFQKLGLAAACYSGLGYGILGAELAMSDNRVVKK